MYFSGGFHFIYLTYRLNKLVIPPGSTGLLVIGESFQIQLSVPCYSLNVHPIIKKRVQGTFICVHYTCNVNLHYRQPKNRKNWWCQPIPCQTITNLQPSLQPLSFIIRTTTNTGILNNKIGFKYNLGFFFFWVDCFFYYRYLDY